jgi:hypothetical protein
MNLIEKLQEYIKRVHRQGIVTLTPPLSEDGVWFMDFVCGDSQLAIEWSPATGFGVSSLSDESYGERPDEAFQSLDDMQRRVTELLTSNERTVPPLGVLETRRKNSHRNWEFDKPMSRLPGEWQAEMTQRVLALGYAGWMFGPGINWWPIDKHQNKVAGPFTSTEAFDLWLTQQEM